MKKISIGIIALLSIGVGIYFFLFSSILPERNINHISIISHASEDMTIYGNESTETILEIVNTLNQGQGEETPVSFSPDYTMEIGYTDRETHRVDMDFETENKRIHLYIPTKEKYYSIENDAAGYFMMNKNFRDIYAHSKRPIGHFKINDTVRSFDSSETEWSYKQANGTWATIVEGQVSPSSQELISDGSDVFHLRYDLEPNTTDLIVRDGDTILYEETLNEGHFMPLSKEGTYTYELVSYWDNNINRGRDTTTLDITVDLPVRFRMAKTTATAGDFFTIFADFVNSDEELFLEQTLIPNAPSFFDVDGTKMAFIPLNYWAKVGNYKIKAYSNKTEKASENAQVFDVKVKHKAFKKQYLYVDESVDKATRNDDAYTQYGKYFNPARDTITSEKLWQGPFIAPVEGRISTEFGEMRYVNDALTSYRHSGTDYAVPKGTPVKAPNRGRVNLSMFLTLTGNTVVIDHGLGLFSVYFHMDSLNVEKGQMVNQGEVIGTVGSTGFSTGPHLHYTTSIGKTNFDSLILSGYDPAQN